MELPELVKKWESKEEALSLKSMYSLIGKLIEENKKVSLKCSACGREYNPKAWPNAWRCNNCF